MYKKILFYLLFSSFFIFSSVMGCIVNIDSSQPGPSPTANIPSSSILINTPVWLSPGGGEATLTFSISGGQQIRFTLTCMNISMEPYGFLEYPDGITSIYIPVLGNSLNGVNTSELVLTQSGTYTYVIFDGSNIGGQVNVKIEVI